MKKVKRFIIDPVVAILVVLFGTILWLFAAATGLVDWWLDRPQDRAKNASDPNCAGESPPRLSRPLRRGHRSDHQQNLG